MKKQSFEEDKDEESTPKLAFQRSTSTRSRKMKAYAGNKMPTIEEMTSPTCTEPPTNKATSPKLKKKTLFKNFTTVFSQSPTTQTKAKQQ